MFVSHTDDDAAVAMQEIEVISMDDGEDNVTTTSLSSPSSTISSPSPSLISSSDELLSTSSANLTGSQDEEAMSVLFAMISDEHTLPSIDHHARSNVRSTPISDSSASPSSTTPSSSIDELDPVNDHDRVKMCDWYYEMSDFLKIDRSTASRSLTFLDRFMTTPVHHRMASSSVVVSSADKYNLQGVIVAASRNRDEYQLVALTALFLSIKLFERLNIQPQHVSYLSRGRYTSEEVVKMEVIMLAALEWKVCMPDKVDYVDAFLDVLFPQSSKRRSSVYSCEEEESASSSNGNVLLSSLKDLAKLQIQLSDFDSSFSTQRQSMVALAAVINAFEMKKDKLSEVDQHIFLENLQGMMNKMYYGITKEREELARTVERLRILVDPPSAASCTGGSSIDNNLTPTSYQQQQQNNYHAQQPPPPVHEVPRHTQVSPLEVALESVEAFDITQLFCCGTRRHSFQKNINGHGQRAVDNDDVMATDEDIAKLNNATSFRSVESIHGKSSRGNNIATNHSPTSIATILFGASPK